MLNALKPPSRSGKIEFINSEGVEKGSLELLESDSGSAGKDVVKVVGIKMDGGTYSTSL